MAMFIEAYYPALFPFAGKQRKGIREAIDGCRSIRGHINRALAEPSPLELGTPIPAVTAQAAKFAAIHGHRELEAFWGEHLIALEGAVTAAAPPQGQWNKAILPPIRTASGKTKAVAIKKIAAHFGVGLGNWMGQFAVGFPITGVLSQKHTFPSKEPKGHPIHREQLFYPADARFRERAPKSGWGNAKALRDVAFILWGVRRDYGEFGWPPGGSARWRL